MNQDEEAVAGLIEYLIIDDYYGLWEVLEHLTPEFAAGPETDLRKLAERVLVPDSENDLL